MNIPKVQDRNPPLKTFFEDLKHLEPLASSMKLLIDPPAKQTSIYTLFLKSFMEMDRNLAVVTGLSDCFACKTFLNWGRRRCGRSQIVRSQQFFELVKRTPGDFAQLANSFGFRSPAITAHVANPDKVTAKEFFPPS